MMLGSKYHGYCPEGEFSVPPSVSRQEWTVPIRRPLELPFTLTSGEHIIGAENASSPHRQTGKEMIDAKYSIQNKWEIMSYLHISGANKGLVFLNSFTGGLCKKSMSWYDGS